MPRALRVHLTADGIRGLLAVENPSHDDVLTAIGGHYGGGFESTDPLDEAARSLFGTAGAPCDVQAARLAELLFHQLGLSPDEHSAGALILPEVLVTRRADPLVIAMLGHEIARRAGLESHVCTAGDDAWTALLDAENCTLVGASPLVCAGLRESGFHVACAHETAVVLLERLARRAVGRAQRCAVTVAAAMRSGSRDAGRCAGHAF
jgi:Transglutaminase-like superfamily